MMMIRFEKGMGLSKFAVIITLLVTVVFFQNCNSASFLNSAPSSQSGSESDSGGQPYDGKPYVVRATCPDGTSIDSRVLLTGPTSGMLVRENCQDITPITVTISYDPKTPSVLSFNSRSFSLEEAIAVKALASGYMQWSNALRSIAAPTVYFVDGMGYSAGEIQGLRSAGHTVVCMITAGVTRTSDPDYSSFTASDIGNQSQGTPEYWLDTRSANVRSVLLARLASIGAKGCNGILWDQTDAHTNDSGFPLNSDTAIDFARALAFAAHDRGYSVALSNTGDLSSALVNYFDMQYSGGSCMSRGTCGRFSAFSSAGKPIFAHESATSHSASLCSSATAAGISMFYTDANGAGTTYTPCP